MVFGLVAYVASTVSDICSEKPQYDWAHATENYIITEESSAKNAEIEYQARHKILMEQASEVLDRITRDIKANNK